MMSLLIVTTVLGCTSSPLAPESAVVTQIVVTPDMVTSEAGRAARFTTLSLDADGNPVPGAQVEWSSVDPSIAVVDSDGTVWSFSAGTTGVEAKSKGNGRSTAPGQVKKAAAVTVQTATQVRPGGVTDLAVDTVMGNTINLVFTEVDDGADQPANYLFRFQIAPLSWSQAANVTFGSCGGQLSGIAIGNRRVCSVSNLAEGTNYEFQVIAFRGRITQDPVYGDLSNIVGASTAVTQTATPTGDSAEYPNEPAGLGRIAQHGFSCRPGAGCADAGEWTERSSTISNLNIVDVADGPFGPSQVVRLRFPANVQDGRSYHRFDGWGPAINENGQYDYSELYVSFWMRIEGSDFENQTVGTKVFYVAYGSTSRTNHSAMFVDGTFRDQEVMSRMKPSYYIYEMEDDGSDAGGGSERFATGNEAILPGTWQHIEAHFKINDIGPTVDNGEFNMWVNGVKTHQLTGLRWRSDMNPLGFYHLQFTPIWGGLSGDVRTREDFWQIDNFYISARD